MAIDSGAHRVTELMDMYIRRGVISLYIPEGRKKRGYWTLDLGEGKEDEEDEDVRLRDL